MVNESRTFGAVVGLTVVGLLIMLYGVSLNSGQALNAPMLAGGGVLLVATAALTAGIGAISADESEA